MTIELTSLLPNAEDVQAQQTMKMVQIHFADIIEWKVLSTKFDFVDNKDGTRLPVSAIVHKLANPTIRGYLPSKVWGDKDGYHLLYYVSASLPPQARPFGDQPCYVFVIRPRGLTVEYDAETRIFIDQIQDIDGDIAYCFVFGHDQMKSVLATDFEGNEWPISIPDDLSHFKPHPQ